MDVLIFILLIVGIIFLSMSWAKSELQCPPQRIIYKYIPQNTLDVQFGQDNSPSEIYKDMFLNGNTWIGGYQLGTKGKTQSNTTQSNTTQSNTTQSNTIQSNTT
jgi:hypothetical protein